MTSRVRRLFTAQIAVFCVRRALRPGSEVDALPCGQPDGIGPRGQAAYMACRYLLVTLSSRQRAGAP